MSKATPQHARSIVRLRSALSDRASSVGRDVAISAVVLLVGAGVGVLLGPLVGGVAGIVAGAVVGLVWPTAIERRLKDLDSQVGDLTGPRRIVTDAEHLTRQRRYGPTSGSYGRDAHD